MFELTFDSVCASADRVPMFTVRGVEKVTGAIINSLWGFVDGEPRVHYLPSANVLVNLPESNDRVVLRPLNLIDALNEAGQDYLFVLSRPDKHVPASGTFTYRMDIRSKAGGVRCKLESGPEGMTVSPGGRLRWQVPANLEGKTVPVIVTIGDSSGKDIQHSFEINVE